MKILCFIDSLGSGGAQRQLVNLAIGFKDKGHSVSFLVYSNGDFYEKLLIEKNIEIHKIAKCGYFKRILQCREYIRKGNFDAVLSFLETPSLIAELSTFPFRRWKLIVGERSSDPKILSTIKGRYLRFMHLFADVVVSNSETNKLMVKKANPFLPNKKNVVIYNLYDLNELSPDSFVINHLKNDGKFHILVAASHQYLKNLKNLAIAISLLDENERNRIVIDWYGKQINPCFSDSCQLIGTLGLNDNFKFYSPTLDIYNKMLAADAVGLFSLYEGLSNTICEAMCLGKPVIATNVSDNKILLNNVNLISEAEDPISISKSLRFIINLSETELIKIGKENRKRALLLFEKGKILDYYLKIMA